MDPKPHNTAKVEPGIYCSDCGWPTIFACCNDAMANAPPYEGHDWWIYCSNKACPNHAGEAYPAKFTFRAAGA